MHRCGVLLACPAAGGHTQHTLEAKRGRGGWPAAHGSKNLLESTITFTRLQVGDALDVEVLRGDERVHVPITLEASS